MYNNLKRTYMKGTEQFKEIIKNYLDNRAKEDELFRSEEHTSELQSPS